VFRSAGHSPGVGGVTEIVTNDSDGFIVTPKDVEAMTCAIEKFVESPQLIDSMRKNTLETAKNRTWDNVFGKLFDEYRELIENKIG
jgi:glycosyltransferase involved in cell wall biosynthesis